MLGSSKKKNRITPGPGPGHGQTQRQLAWGNSSPQDGPSVMTMGGDVTSPAIRPEGGQFVVHYDGKRPMTAAEPIPHTPATGRPLTAPITERDWEQREAEVQRWCVEMNRLVSPKAQCAVRYFGGRGRGWSGYRG